MNEMKILRRFAVPAILLFLADQFTKMLAASRLKGKGSVPVVKGVFELLYLENTGAAFGILKNRQWIFMLFAAVIICAVSWFCCRYLLDDRKYLPLRAVCALMCAGAAGNLADRILHGYVIDFLYFSLIDFPVFNLADVYVCAASALLFILLLFYYKDKDLNFGKAGE